jgi:hypothetical protein
MTAACATAIHDVSKDYAGICSGSSVADECGVCNGGNANKDCVGVCDGSAVQDDCGVCNGGNANKDCAGVCNSPACCVG